MATIKFKAKVHTMYDMDDKPLYRYITIPELKRSHCDMNAFRQHPKFGAYANSDIFPSILAREKTKLFGTSNRLHLDAIPDGVKVDTSGFLAMVTIEI